MPGVKTNENIIDLIAEATWVSCLTDTQEEAKAFEMAANLWVEGHPFQLAECPFEEHVPFKAFFLAFEAGAYDDGWACYCHCSWVLHPKLRSIRDALVEAEKFCDTDGVSSLFLEWVVFGDDGLTMDEELPDGRPLCVYDPELRIFVVHQREVDEYLVCGGYGTVHLEKIDTRAFEHAAGS